MWQSLRLAQKIWCGLSILLFGYVVSIVLGVILVWYTGYRLQGLESTWFPAAMQSQQASSDFRDLVSLYAEAVISGDAELLSSAEEEIDEVNQALDTIAMLPGLDQERHHQLQELQQQFAAFTTSAQRVYAEMSSSSAEGDHLAALTELQQQAASLAQQTQELQGGFGTIKTAFSEHLQREIAAIRTRSRQNSYLSVIVFVAVVGLALWAINALMKKSITRPLSRLVATANAIADGDVSQQFSVTSHDEIGELADAFQSMNGAIRAVLGETERVIQAIREGDLQTNSEAAAFHGSWRDLVEGISQIREAFIAPIQVTAVSLRQIAQGEIPPEILESYQGDFDKMRDDLNVLIQSLRGFTFDIREAAGQLASGSRQLHDSADHLSRGASQQSATSEEVSSTIEQISANIRQNAENASQTAATARQSADDARQSGEAVAQTVQAIKGIARTIKVIEEIAQQTHMLSLNATIEAAKAEEHGRGFAVVASEVRSLAKRSQEAAEEINQLATSSVRIAENAGTMLAHLVPTIESTSELVQEISSAGNEQKIGVEQINHAMQELDLVIQQNAGISEETAATADTLLQQAGQLQKVVAFFRILESRHKRDTPSDADEMQPTSPHAEALPAQTCPGSLRAPENRSGTELASERERSVEALSTPLMDDKDSEFERY